MARAIAFLTLVTACLAASPVFEVASVKPVGFEVIKPIDLKILPGGRLVATNCNLRVLMMDAYEVKAYQIVGGPDWTDSERFDIAATSGNNETADAAQVKLMLQSLLANRFRLRLHRESRVGIVYDLVTAKGGPKLTAASAGTESWVRSRLGANKDGSTLAMVGQSASLSMLAERLGLALQRPVLNETEIAGEFDFRFEYAADDEHTEAAPPLVKAIRELGLRLEMRKGPVDTLVIESAERPAEN